MVPRAMHPGAGATPGPGPSGGAHAAAPGMNFHWLRNRTVWGYETEAQALSPEVRRLVASNRATQHNHGTGSGPGGSAAQTPTRRQ